MDSLEAQLLDLMSKSLAKDGDPGNGSDYAGVTEGWVWIEDFDGRRMTDKVWWDGKGGVTFGVVRTGVAAAMCFDGYVKGHRIVHMGGTLDMNTEHIVVDDTVELSSVSFRFTL